MNDDYSFAEDLDEEEELESNDDKEKKKIIKFVIIVVVAAVVGIAVYFITDALINGKQEEPTGPVERADQEMSLNDEMVTYLYGNVSYAVVGVRNNTFFKAAQVTANDFTDAEKFHYAMRYAIEADFVDMGVNVAADDELLDDEEDEEGEPQGPHIWAISNNVVREYMYNFFGSSVTYSTSSEIPIGLNFQKNGYNAGTLKYDSSSDTFRIQFDSVTSLPPIKPVLGKLTGAMREGKSDDIILTEKVVFAACPKQYEDEAGNAIDKYDCTIYKDAGGTQAIQQMTGVSKSQLQTVGVENFLDDATTVKYRFFKDENDEYHFSSSELS